MTARKKGVVVGGGTMGADLAAMFLANGVDAEVVEIDPAARQKLPERVAISVEEIGSGIQPGRLRVITAIGEIDWSGVEIVIETAFERLPVKQEVFAALDKV